MRNKKVYDDRNNLAIMLECISTERRHEAAYSLLKYSTT
jgi:hypothetical protein